MAVPAKMHNPNLSMKNISDYKWEKDIPTRDNCDLDDPKEMFLWTYTALPGQNGGQLPFPPSYLMMTSEHQWECGVQLGCRECGHMAEPLKKYRRPSGVEANWMTSPGVWVPNNAPDVPRNAAKDVVPKMPLNQQAEAFEALVEHLPIEVLQKVLEKKRDST